MDNTIRRRIPFVLFFISGFCGLLYQVVWLRLAFRSFGIITPVLSVVISVFMLGLAIGTWAGGRWINTLSRKTGISPVFYYAIVEFLTGVGAFAVPALFGVSESYLLRLGQMDSLSYLALSAVLILLSILPWCILMGLTFPFMMAFLKGADRSDKTGFSFLYLANVMGAMSGTLVTAVVLIEILGFSRTLLVAGLANFAIAVLALYLGVVTKVPALSAAVEERAPLAARGHLGAGFITAVLFITGFASMALEVVWTRAFTPVLTTTIYAFAFLVAVYLLATWLGSFVYRRGVRAGRVLSNGTLFALLAISTFFPIVVNDPRINTDRAVLLLTIFPFCAVLGYLTPKLIDVYSEGRPREAGLAYAVNIVGSIVGPLFASYVLLPSIGSKNAMVLLSLPFPVMFFLNWRATLWRPSVKAGVAALSVALFLTSLFINISYEERFGPLDFSHRGVTRRDYTATTVAYGSGMRKRLYVNGIGLTVLSQITKMMAHWPLVLMDGKPESALVICFGMGTTFRSLMSWPIRVTAVELVPGVKDSFGYFFPDGPHLFSDPRASVVIDDGRRFLKRTRERFDLITIDPPPPPEAAGSGFLYSRDFYEIVKSRLTDRGILAQWFPGDEPETLKSVTMALMDAFPYVRAYRSIFDWGVHFIASMSPVEEAPVGVLLGRMPHSAIRDLVEWYPMVSPGFMLSAMLVRSFDPAILVGGPSVPMLTDDRPVNEYYILRRTSKKFFSRSVSY